MRITAAIDVDASPAVVWSCIAEPDKIVRWVEGALDHRYVGARTGRPKVGDKFVQRLKQGRKVVEFEGTLTACEEPSHFAFTIPSPAYSSEAHFRLTPQGSGGTHVDYSIDVTLHTLAAKIAGAALRVPLAFFVRKQLRRLRALAVSLSRAAP